jgi:lysyl-tRNA synthetase class 2
MDEQDHNEYHVRLNKLKTLKIEGIIPYADRFERSHNSVEAVAHGEKISLRPVEEILKSKNSETLKLCGRLVSFREHGKLTFAHLQDFAGKIQICFMEDLIGKEKYKFLRKLDVADFVGVTGELFRTKHGEITLMVYETKLLSKALRPLPEKWHGIKDAEAIYRQRYLDLIMNRESMNRFILRSDLIKALREFYWSEGFIEIETPVLESVSSGATARPFITHHNALDIDMYLRIAAGELWQKSAIVGGFEKTFEVARCFRNEGMDPSHLQEFTMIEHYAAYWDYEDNMKFTERMFEYMLKKLTGTTVVKIKDRDGNDIEVDFKAPWPRKEYAKLIEDDCGINILDYSEGDELRKEIKKKGIYIDDMETLGYGNLVDGLYKKVTRPKLINPTFVIKHPSNTKPLARKNDDDPRVCDTFQLLVNTWEIINAYSELVDPVDQRERFEAQASAKAEGDAEAMFMNEDYLTTMEHGMPCISGWGMGIDRLMTLLTAQENLKDVVMFPLMRPLEETIKKNQKAMEKAKKKIGK